LSLNGTFKLRLIKSALRKVGTGFRRMRSAQMRHLRKSEMPRHFGCMRSAQMRHLRKSEMPRHFGCMRSAQMRHLRKSEMPRHFGCMRSAQMRPLKKDQNAMAFRMRDKHAPKNGLLRFG